VLLAGKEYVDEWLDVLDKLVVDILLVYVACQFNLMLFPSAILYWNITCG
jgi:hypothetical protein